jgi:very-short-patch-repair endonuclease
MTQRRIRTSANVQQAAKDLRKKMTPAEKLFWERVRNRRLNGMKFRRQHPLEGYIADFYCLSERFVIEVDGDIHKYQIDQDAERTQALEAHGYRVVRFRNQDIENDLEGVIQTIVDTVAQSTPNEHIKVL